MLTESKDLKRLADEFEWFDLCKNNSYCSRLRAGEYDPGGTTTKGERRSHGRFRPVIAQRMTVSLGYRNMQARFCITRPCRHSRPKGGNPYRFKRSSYNSGIVKLANLQIAFRFSSFTSAITTCRVWGAESNKL